MQNQEGLRCRCGPIEIVQCIAIIAQRCAVRGTNLLLRLIECTFQALVRIRQIVDVLQNIVAFQSLVI